MQHEFNPDALFDFPSPPNLKYLAPLTPLLPDNWLADHPESQLQIRTTEANKKSGRPAHDELSAAKHSNAPETIANNTAPFATLTIVPQPEVDRSGR